MTTKEALEIVMGLAEQNAMSMEDEADTKELKKEAKRQADAIQKIYLLLDMLFR